MPLLEKTSSKQLFKLISRQFAIRKYLVQKAGPDGLACMDWHNRYASVEMSQ